MRALLLLCLLAACGDSRLTQAMLPAPEAPARDQLRVLSYNVNFGIAGDPSTIAAIADTKADLVLLQETNEQWENTILHTVGAQYPYHRFDGPGNDWVAGGMGMLSKFPIIRVDVLPPPPGGLFVAWRVLVDTPLGTLQVFNLHLRPPMSDGGSWVVGYWSTRDDRLREMQYHLESYDPKLPTLLVGDFNEEGDGKAITLLRDRGFSDAIAQFHGTTPTWQWTVRGVTLKFQLDHILHSAHLVPTAARIVEAGRSDHKPIWADFVRMDP